MSSTDPASRFAVACDVIERQRVPTATGISHALSADTCGAVVDLIRAFEPRSVLELGTGHSTVEIARVIRGLDATEVHSIEHDVGYLQRTRALLESEGLEDAVHLHHAPIGVRRAGAFMGLWYRIDGIDCWPRFDFVLIDGPPSRAVGRFMTLPALWPRLEDGALLVLDDANRSALEGVWLDLWRRIYGTALRVEVYRGFHKGLALMMKVSDQLPGGGPLTFARYLAATADHTARLVAGRVRRATTRGSAGQP